MATPEIVMFILTHGRPENQKTLATLRRYGWAGRTYLVLDDEDKTAGEYRKLYGDEMVLTFSKEEIARRVDEGDNTGDRRVILYARNACFDLAKQVGATYFMQLDDDYQSMSFKFDSKHRYRSRSMMRTFNDVIAAMLEYFIAAPLLTLAMSQGGDHIGGGPGTYNRSEHDRALVIRTKRKAMNSFICSVDRPFTFVGRINEDVNTYCTLGMRGQILLGLQQVSLTQTMTQTSAGGMSEAYAANGTYRKSFYTVMYAPAFASVCAMGSPERSETKEVHYRIHHQIDWAHAVPKIVPERVRKPRAAASLGSGVAASGDGASGGAPGAADGVAGAGDRARRTRARRAVAGGA